MGLFYKATGLDGKSFNGGNEIWEPGEVFHSAKKSIFGTIVKSSTPNLSASDIPSEAIIGGSWPCRLFLVEGESLKQHNHKHSFLQLEVIEELPAWQALGENGQQVAEFLYSITNIIKSTTPTDDKTLIEVQDIISTDAWNLAQHTAFNTALAANRTLALNAAFNSASISASEVFLAPNPTPDTTHTCRGATWGVTCAYMVRDLISQSLFDTLLQPWNRLSQSNASI